VLRRTDRPGGPKRSSPRGRGTAPATTCHALVAIGLVAALLVACSPRPQSGVATTTVRVRGNCDTSRVVEVGATLPLSGTSAALAREYLTGLELGVDDVNKAGGVLGDNRCLELLYKNDRGDSATATQAISDLVDDESVTYVVGPLLPGQIMAAGATLARPGIPTGGLSGIDATFRPAHYPWMFPIAASNATVATKMAQYAAAQSWSRVGIVSAPGAVGDQSVATFTRAARRLGVSVVGRVAVSPRQDASRAVETLRSTVPQGVVILDDAVAITRVLSARAQLGWHAPVVTTASATDAAVVDAVKPPALNEVAAVVPQPLVLTPDASVPAVRSFRDVVRRHLPAGRIDGSIVAFAQAYDAVILLASTANSIHSTSATSLRTYLENAGFQGLLASYSYTTSSHAGIAGDQLAVVPVDSLSNGLFAQPGPARSTS
jgi:ABC-type branched-subunit amino acid transport system substrate-binding protein